MDVSIVKELRFYFDNELSVRATTTQISKKKKKTSHDIFSVAQSSLYFFVIYRKITVKHFSFSKKQESPEKELCMKDVSTQDVH